MHRPTVTSVETFVLSVFVRRFIERKPFLCYLIYYYIDVSRSFWVFLDHQPILSTY